MTYLNSQGPLKKKLLQKHLSRLPQPTHLLKGYNPLVLIFDLTPINSALILQQFTTLLPIYDCASNFRSSDDNPKSSGTKGSEAKTLRSHKNK